MTAQAKAQANAPHSSEHPTSNMKGYTQDC